MDPKNKLFFIGIAVLILAALACGSVQVGVVTPTSEAEVLNIVDVQGATPEGGLPTETVSQPTQEPAEDFSYLWVEYWNPVFNYGLALPAHWEVSTEEGGFMITKSYDLEFFQANSMKGGWIGGREPEGVVKLDFPVFEDVVPEQSLDIAISEILGSNPEMTVVLSVEWATISEQEAVLITTARPDSLEETYTNIAFRLSPETILLVASYPNEVLYSSDVQLILSTLVLDKNTPIVKPTTAPHPPLTVKNEELSGMPTASYAFAWYGHIASLPEGELYDDKVVFPFAAGDFGIKGNTPEIEAQIQALRDVTGVGEYVHLWGVLYCNIDDYNICQLNVQRLEYEGEYTVAVEAVVDKWVGTIQRTTIRGESAYAFVLSGEVPIWYGITSPSDLSIQDQIETLANSDTIVSVWGDLLVGVDDVNGTRIEVNRIDPPSPGAMPSSAACESGYLGSVDEMLEFIQYNLEIGNHWPFSYAIGNPFAIGYWQSEGVAIPRDQAYQQLTEYYLPSPEEVIITTEKAEYPSEYDLYGMRVEDMWGPDVDVAATMFSKGWGENGQGEAILIIARCQGETYDAYFWYGMLYAGAGFERKE
ncbi:MAG: hypothetical protein MUO62_14470 [Anaerolineales bacterium]|nr:hypothetical protein [Anaerolineales bacterium]